VLWLGSSNDINDSAVASVHTWNCILPPHQRRISIDPRPSNPSHGRDMAKVCIITMGFSVTFSPIFLEFSGTPEGKV